VTTVDDDISRLGTTESFSQPVQRYFFLFRFIVFFAASKQECNQAKKAVMKVLRV
jgi:hypothetical protein